MGHEFAAEVLRWPNHQAAARPARSSAIPVLLNATGIEPIVYSNTTAGGYGRSDAPVGPALTEIPNGLDFRHAVLTEPMAVSLHGVNKSHIKPGEGALVLGCGPVGLAIVAALKLKGIDTIVATDFSPARRALATTMGATDVVDPAAEDAFDAWTRAGKGKTLVVFEAIGVPGIIDSVLLTPRTAPASWWSACAWSTTSSTRSSGSPKELNIQFLPRVRPDGVRGHPALDRRGRARRGPLDHRRGGPRCAAGAFAALGNPDEHCKILVVPGG